MEKFQPPYFHFSPFIIKDGVLTVWAGEARIEHEVITYKGEEITPEAFYDIFMAYARDRGVMETAFRLAFEERKQAIPNALWEFAIYYGFKSTFLHRHAV